MPSSAGKKKTLSNEQTERVESKMRKIVADHLAKTGAAIEFLFFLMVRPQPRSTLFPYTTLFRSLPFLRVVWRTAAQPRAGRGGAVAGEPERSEEHTSELQLLRHLVCRLLRER